MDLLQQCCACTSTLVITAILGCVAFWFLNRKQARWATLPPGPKPEPVMGNLRMLVKEKGVGRLRILHEIGKQYGGVYTMWFGKQPKVIVTDYEVMKQCFTEEALQGRPRRFFADLFFNRLGLVYIDGPAWKEHRPFASKTLRDFGAGKPWLASLILDESRDLVRELEAMQAHPFDPSEVITHCVSNILCTIAYGKRFDHQDHQFRRLASLMSESAKLSGLNVLTGVFPWLRFIPFLPFRRRYLKYVANHREMMQFCENLVEDHKKSFRPEEEPRDFIDAYLKEQARQADDPNTTFTREQLIKSILTLFAAGVETTANALCWAIVYLVENPEVYRKLQKEVDEVIPDGGFPNYEIDRPKLPFLEATTMEVLRLSMPVPVPARRTMEPVVMKGFHIPANVTILPNMYSIHYDPEFFPEPLKFDPTRYLDAAGNIKKPPPEGHMPFSFGKRSCYGEALSKMELIIFLSVLVKHFEFRTPPGKTVSSADSMLGLVNCPIPYEMIFAPRSAGRRFSIIGNVRLWE